MYHRFNRLVAGSAALAFLGVTGCSEPSPPPAMPPPAAAVQVTVALPPAPPPAVVTIKIEENLRTACAIDDAKTDANTLFPFDSSVLSTGDQYLLSQLALCLTTGTLHGRVLAVVGRADPRGTEDYNQALGARRAGSVQGYLQARGMDLVNIQASSRGALDASGTDEDGWRADRRVDVALAL